MHGCKELFYRLKRSYLAFFNFLDQPVQFFTRKDQPGKIQPFPTTS